MARRRSRLPEGRPFPKLAVWVLATVATAVIGAVASVEVPKLLDSGGKSSATAVRIFNPVTLTGVNPGLKIIRRDRRQCQTGSESDAGNPNAYRCFGRRSEIYDPCFEAIARLVCPKAPWDS